MMNVEGSCLESHRILISDPMVVYVVDVTNEVIVSSMIIEVGTAARHHVSSSFSRIEFVCLASS